MIELENLQRDDALRRQDATDKSLRDGALRLEALAAEVRALD